MEGEPFDIPGSLPLSKNKYWRGERDLIEKLVKAS